MNILVGAHGVGKTTLLKRLKEVNPEIYITDGFSRPLLKCKQKLNMTGYVFQSTLNEITYWYSIEHLKDNNIYITRSMLDAFVYSRYFNFNDLAEESLRRLEEQMEFHQYFYIPIEFQVEEDENRSASTEYQEVIDYMMKGFLDRNQIKYTTLTGSVEDRIKLINN